MLTVVTPATNRRLTTVGNVRLDLGLASAEPADPAINRLIDQASSAIEAYCNRVFARETVREVSDCVYGPNGILLSRGPVASFTSLSVGGLAYDPADYQSDEGLLFRLNSNGRRTYWGAGRFVVEYAAGYILPGNEGANLPAAIEQAAILEISVALARRGRDPLMRSESVDGVGSFTWQTTPTGGILSHPASASLLQPFRIPAL